MMKNTTIFGIACAAVALFLGYELVEERKASKRKEETYKVDLEREAAKVSREIEQGAHDRILNKSIEDAANRMVSDILSKNANKAVKDITDRMTAEINRRVNSEWSIVKGEVRDKILSKVDRYDISQLKDDVVDAAREKLVDDLSDKLDDLADDINDKYEERAEKLLDTYEKRIKDKMQYRYGMFF